MTNNTTVICVTVMFGLHSETLNFLIFSCVKFGSDFFFHSSLRFILIFYFQFQSNGITGRCFLSFFYASIFASFFFFSPFFFVSTKKIEEKLTFLE